MSDKVTLVTLFVGIIAAFVTAGGGGFMNLIILEKLEFIKLHIDETQEKNFFVMLFSVLNFALFLTLMGGLEVGDKNLEILSTRTVINSILLTVLISAILSFTVLPLVVKVSWVLVNFFRTKLLSLPALSNQTPKEKVFEHYRNTQVYIYTLEGVFIAKGYLLHWGADRIENGEVVLTPPADYEGDDLDIKYVRQMFVECDNPDETIAPRHLIDANNNVQYFIFYQ